MKKIVKKKVKICKIGYFNHSINLQKLLDWKSKYFAIENIDSVGKIEVDHFENDYTCLSEHINSVMGADESNIDLKIGIIDQPLEGNFYMHRLDNKKAVISIFPVIGILKDEKIPIENYIMRCIYEIVVFLFEGKGDVDQNVYLIPHHETRSCLFDMNIFIDRIIFSSVKPTICNECKTRLNAASLPDGFISDIEKELKKINLPLYYRIENKIKKRPIVSLIVTAIFAVILDISAHFIFEIIHKKDNEQKLIITKINSQEKLLKEELAKIKIIEKTVNDLNKSNTQIRKTLN